jgi:hypothetical protein
MVKSSYNYPYPDYQAVPTKRFIYRASDVEPVKVYSQKEFMLFFLRTVRDAKPKTVFTASNLFEHTDPNHVCPDRLDGKFSELEINFIKRLHRLNLIGLKLKFCLDCEDKTPTDHACFYKLARLLKKYTEGLESPNLIFLYRPRLFKKSLLKLEKHIQPKIVVVPRSIYRNADTGLSSKIIVEGK